MVYHGIFQLAIRRGSRIVPLAKSTKIEIFCAGGALQAEDDVLTPPPVLLTNGDALIKTERFL
jgi:hypothetical protein